ncbi:MAG: hypothetical protein DCO96_10505 [Fluviicola sp. XM-24bin1]|nr:MAG: hypothetical protein DCO96_10505 [Fluviicola sp. XM-24bin1]
MKTTGIKLGIVTMIVLFLSCMGTFVFANGTPTGNPILEIDNQSFNGVYDPGAGHLITNDITELMCEKVEVDFIGIEIDASSGSGQMILAIYENGNLMSHSGLLTIQGGVDELVGFNPMSTLEMHASSVYTLGVMYSSPDPVFFKTTDSPVHLGSLDFSVLSTSIDMNSAFPVLPSTLNGANILDSNLGFRIMGTSTSTHTDATMIVNSCGEFNAPSGTATYTSNGIYTDVIPNAAGCDSVITLHVSINEPVYETEFVDACSDYTWAENNQTYTTSGTYSTQYVGSNGCDSIRVLELVVHNGANSISHVSSCEIYTWPENGQTYTTSGVYTETYQNVLGCDSVVTLDLTIGYPVFDVAYEQSCGEYYWEESGQTYTTSGTYSVTKHVDGQPCPHYYELNLTVHPEVTMSQTESACGAFTWPVDGNIYTTSGTYTGYIASSTGCDTLVTLDLVINEPVQSVDVVITCATSYTWANGVTYTSNNNTASMVYQSVSGCDSIVTLNLYFSSTQNAVETVTSCGPFTWIDGVTYLQTPTGPQPSVTHTNSQGCDQITYLDLTILEPTTGTHSVTTCGSYTWIDGNTYTASNNTATHTLTNAAGCDSVVTLDLTIAPIDNSVSVNGLTLTSNQPNAQYQWYEDVNGLQIIPGATGQSFTATQNGSYVVEVSQSNCIETSNAMLIGSAGLTEEAVSLVTISPNPSNGEFKINGDWVSAELYDLTGRMITLDADPVSKRVQAGDVAKGKYILTVQLENSEIVVLDVLIE